MKVHVFNQAGQLVGPVESAPVVKTDAEWRAQLTREQFGIARNKRIKGARVDFPNKPWHPNE